MSRLNTRLARLELQSREPPLRLIKLLDGETVSEAAERYRREGYTVADRIMIAPDDLTAEEWVNRYAAEAERWAGEKHG